MKNLVFFREKSRDFVKNKVIPFDWQIFFKNNWRDIVIIIIFAILIYIIFPKYAGELSICTGNIECNCFGYSYTTWKGIDHPYKKRCIGVVFSCKKTSMGNEDYCS